MLNIQAFQDVELLEIPPTLPTCFMGIRCKVDGLTLTHIFKVQYQEQK